MNENDFANIYNEFAEYRHNCPFALDGIVIKPTEDFRINNTTEHRPSDCVAIKFIPQLQETEIVDIYEPEGQELTEGTVFIDLPDKKSKIKKTASTDYGKIAKAIGDIRAAGIKVSLVDINKSQFGFAPDVENNRILFGLKGMLNVGDDVIAAIIANRPYASPKDFLQKVKPGKQAMISLIKGGAFDDMEDRKFVMAWYLWETCDKKSRITLQNMGGLIKHNLLPEHTEEHIMARRVYEFNRYLKAVCKVTGDAINYHLDARAMDFLAELGCDELISEKDFAFVMGVILSSSC